MVQSPNKEGSGALEVLRLGLNPFSHLQSLAELDFFCVGLHLASLTRTFCYFEAKIGVPLPGHVVDRRGDRRQAQIRTGVKSVRVLQVFAGKEEIDEATKFQRRKARNRFPFVSAQGSAEKKKIRIYPGNILVWACFGNQKANFVLHDKRKARGVWKSQPGEFLGIKGI
ncbi:hypothetical protein U1Q18_006781 [Sarracenia purpurea var. burkii]